MKKTWTLAMVLGALLTSIPAQASLTEPVLIAFGQNGAKQTAYNTKAYRGVESTWNVLRTTTSDTQQAEFAELKYANGQAAEGVSVTLSTPTTGAGGCISSFAGDTGTLNNVLDTSAVYGSVNGQGGTSITFSGLKAGTYTLQVLGARGNAVYTGTVTYGITGDGVTVTSASVLASAHTASIAAPVLNDDHTVSATTHRTGSTANQADNWALMEYTFTVGDNGSFTVNATGGGGNIAAMMLIPEPATASLGLLGAFGLLLRRRRK